MDPVALGFTIVLGIEFVVIGILVTYLLYRPRDKKEQPKLRPDSKVATDYGEPNHENGHVLIDIKISPEDKSDISSMSSDFKKTFELDPISMEIEKVPLYQDTSPTIIEVDQEKSSSSSSSENEDHEVDEAIIAAVHVTSDEEGNRGLSKYVSENETKQEEKSTQKNELVEERPFGAVYLGDGEEQGRKLSSSSSDSSGDEDFALKHKLVPLKRTKLVKDFVETISSSSDSPEAGSTDNTLTRTKRKKAKRLSESSSTSDEEVVNHKKKTRRKRYIHNIEEVEIIEEHTINKTHKTIYQKSLSGQEPARSNESDLEKDSSKNYISTAERYQQKTIDGLPCCNTFSSSDDEREISGRSDSNYHSSYHFDVAKNNKQEGKHMTTSFIKKSVIPLKHGKDKRTYTETIQEDITRNMLLTVDGSDSSNIKSEARLKSEKDILVSTTPRYKKFSATISLEKDKDTHESSSSSSSESEEERRIRSETNVRLKSPCRECSTETFMTRSEHESEYQRSLSSFENQEDNARVSSSTQIKLRSPTQQQTFTATVDATYQSDLSDGEVTFSSKRRLSKSPRVINLDKKFEEANSNALKPHVSSEFINVNKTADLGQQDLRKVSTSTENFEFTRKVDLDETSSQTKATNENLMASNQNGEKKKSYTNFLFVSGWKKKVDLGDLVDTGIVPHSTVVNLVEGKIQQENVEKSIRRYLFGEEPVAGLIIPETGEKISIYNAWKKGLIRRGTSISLLEAQAATGRIINPVSAEKMSVREATQARLIDRQFEAVLASAEKAVYGYRTNVSHEKLSLFEAINKGLIVENQGVRLLEAQIATGGIIDPKVNFRLPVEVAYKRGLIDDRINGILKDPSEETRGFFDPNSEENLTYHEILDRCVIDKDTGLRLLPLKKQKEKQALQVSKVVFESATKRQVLLQDIMDAELVDLKTAQKFDEGHMTTDEVQDMVAQLKVYVDGTLPIAGVINSLTGEKMSIYDAYRAGLIRKGTAFELLEAQAACGKIMDVHTGKSVSVETAVATGVLNRELEDAVRRAYRAVAGYREPYKREVLSLCEAMARHLVVQRHAVRLLEAQIATGGIIEMKSPVRIKVEIALKRGLIDRKLAQKLEKRETASYFDPVTGENLNYSELMGRCVLDKDTNLLFLMIEGGTVTQNIRPFEPEPESMKIRNKSQAKITTEVVRAKRKKSDLTTGDSSGTVSIPSSPPAILHRRVVIVDPNTGTELSIQEATEQKLIDEKTAKQLLKQEQDFDENEHS